MVNSARGKFIKYFVFFWKSTSVMRRGKEISRSVGLYSDNEFAAIRIRGNIVSDIIVQLELNLCVHIVNDSL